MLNSPSRLTFWRLVAGISAPLAALAALDALTLAEKLGIAPLTSKTWLALLSALLLVCSASLAFIALSFYKQADQRLTLLEKTPLLLRWPGALLFATVMLFYPLGMLQPYYGDLLARQTWLRLFLFWALSLLGALAFRLAVPGCTWQAALPITLLLHASLYRVMLYLPEISAYPFAMGWSETSRYYYPALFISQKIFGQALAWPILHPSLHLLLVPPYLLDAPLWFHRFWQVGLRFLLLGLIAPALLYRLKLKLSSQRWLIGLWLFLALLSLPLYLHLAVPVFMMLWGFSAKDTRRTWLWLLLASVWAGLSRINWYPMPGILAATLYILETPVENKGWRYLLKPGAWLLSSTLLAFISMQAYIALSGVPTAANFYTSLSSSLLWQRLWPNESYALGVLPAIMIYSAPLWLILFFGWRQGRQQWGVLRPILLLGALLVLFVGGIFVSMKIGGGADIHNMDAYAVLLLIISAYLFFARYTPENNQPAHQPVFHWGVAALLVLVLAYFSAQSSGSILQYNPAASNANLAAMQNKLDTLHPSDGPVLFITQRQLISMGMLQRVTLIPEYEREELMEMAMAHNESYLQGFRADLEKHRFAAIIVDPLRFNYVGEQDAMGAENNAWTRYIVKRILCNYQQESIFPADRIAIYVPQTGEQKCPQESLQK